MGNSSAHRKAQILLTFFLGIIFLFVWLVRCSTGTDSDTLTRFASHVYTLFLLFFLLARCSSCVEYRVKLKCLPFRLVRMVCLAFCRAIQSHTKYVIIAAVVGAFATRAIFSLFLPLPLRAMCVCCVDSVLVVHAVSEFLCQTCIRIHPFSISLQILFFVWLIFRFSVFCCESSARTNWSIACCFMLSHKVVNKQHKRNCAFSIGLR